MCNTLHSDLCIEQAWELSKFPQFSEIGLSLSDFRGFKKKKKKKKREKKERKKVLGDGVAQLVEHQI